jgi:hypothetical protein
MEDEKMNMNERIEKAAVIKKQIETLEPCTQWGHTASIWQKADMELVRIYLNDKKRHATAWIDVNKDGTIMLHQTAGNSMSRNALMRAFDIPMVQIR